MPNCKNNRFNTIVTVQRDITALAKINEPLSKFNRHIIQRTANLGLVSQNMGVLTNAFDGLASHYRIVISQKIM